VVVVVWGRRNNYCKKLIILIK